MTFESIILKLAPFTYINKEQEVQWGTWDALSDGDNIITINGVVFGHDASNLLAKYTTEYI